MSYTAYFIGGPLDLTKKVVPRAERTFYCAQVPMISGDLLRDTPAEVFVFRHEYRLLGHERVYGALNNPILIYSYFGVKA